MFEDINLYKIKIFNKPKNGLFYIPNITSMHPLDKLFSATEWLVLEAIKDYQRTHYLINRRRKERGASQKNIDTLESFETRLGSRTQSYVNQLCLMEDILLFEYERFSALIGEIGYSKLTFDPKNDYQSLCDRLNDIRLFRNKVVAHTAYTYPKIDRKNPQKTDNPETIVRSILNLFPENGSVKLGGNYFSGWSKHRSQLPIITIYNWESEIKPILLDWKSLFIERFKKIHAYCPYENKQFRIEIATPHLIKQNKE